MHDAAAKRLPYAAPTPLPLSQARHTVSKGGQSGSRITTAQPSARMHVWRARGGGCVWRVAGAGRVECVEVRGGGRLRGLRPDTSTPHGGMGVMLGEERESGRGYDSVWREGAWAGRQRMT